MSFGGAGYMMLASVAGAAISQSMAPKPPKPPALPQVAAAPQASKAPNTQDVANATAGQGQAGGAPGIAQTFLTGAGGVNPNQLNLQKSTLLGG